MNRNQWYALSIIFVILGWWFTILDAPDNTDELFNGELLELFDVYWAIHTEIYDPFIWLFFILGIIVFPIMAWLEPKKK